MCSPSIVLLALIAQIAFFDKNTEAVPLPLKRAFLPLFFNDKQSAKTFRSPPSESAADEQFFDRQLTPLQQALLVPYAAEYNGLISQYPSSDSDRMTEQLVPKVKRTNAETHFIDPYDDSTSWLSLSQPSRLEWNFNRLR